MVLGLKNKYDSLLMHNLTENSASLKDNSGLLKNAIDYIEKNYKRAITLKELCANCCVSKQHLNRCFNKSLNITPMAFVIQYKIFKACDMLKQPDYSIKAISFELGFDNQCYFSKVFKRVTGESPSNYKQRFIK